MESRVKELRLARRLSQEMLGQSLTFVSFTAQLVQHRVYNRIQQAHRETCDECTDQIYGKCHFRAGMSGQELNAHAYKTDSYRDKRCFFISYFLQ